MTDPRTVELRDAIGRTIFAETFSKTSRTANDVADAVLIAIEANGFIVVPADTATEATDG